MEETARRVDDLCPRCLQPVTVKMARCPNCGDRLPGFRRLPLLLGSVGLLALLFLLGLMVVVIRNDDIENSPPTGAQQSGDSQPSPASQPPLNP
jgi:hypothetical protein